MEHVYYDIFVRSILVRMLKGVTLIEKKDVFYLKILDVVLASK